MKKGALYYMIGIAVTLVLNSCERRPLTYNYHPWGEIRVNVDWTAFGETPTGMTLMFFPENGGEPIVTVTTETSSTVISLKAARYNILVFNQSTVEFGSLDFRGMENYNTAEVFTKEITSQWYASKGNDEKPAREPERLGVGRMENFEMTEDMVKESTLLRKQNLNSETVTLTLHPQCIVATAIAKVRVKGVHNVRSIRGAMTGMAEGHYLAQGKTNERKVTHLLEEWKIKSDETNYTMGEVTATFTTFGLPAEKVIRADEMMDNHLVLSFLLVDNRTVKDFEFNVTDRIEKIEEELILTVEVGTSTSVEDKPVEVEDVKPENGSEGGFDATVDKWEDETEIEVPA